MGRSAEKTVVWITAVAAKNDEEDGFHIQFRERSAGLADLLTLSYR